MAHTALLTDCLFDRSGRRFGRASLLRFSLGASALALLSAIPAHAQSADDAPAAGVDLGQDAAQDIVITGSRRAVRSLTDIPSPVDVISAEEVRHQGSPDMINLLRTVVPSLNINDNPLSAAAANVRPVVLRGMSPDHTLVLVNGKRRHRAADIPSFSGGISDGAQGPDISSIPTIALQRVEVLRDGAAAQYGSDAIAGVVNFVMSDSPDGGTIQAKYGSTYEGDGDTYEIAGTWGTKLGEAGFIRFSAEFSEQDPTTRAVQRGDAAALQAAGYPDVPDPATRFGTPKFRNNLKTFVNAGVETGFGGQLYLFGGYSTRKATNDFFYRNPTGRGGVFTDIDDGGNYLVGDMTPNDGVTCPGGIDFGGTGVVNDPIAVGSPDAAARLAQVMASPNCFTALSLYPGGYSPLFGTKVTDMSGSIGLRGDIVDNLSYDVSLTAGRNKISTFVSNTMNPSLGTATPTSFYDGATIQSELTFDASLNYKADIGLASPLNIAGGFQWHRERFQIVAGQRESYEAGVLATQGFLVGEESNPGYSDAIAGTWQRSNISFYLDLETDVTEALTLGAAARLEDFTDFGTEVTYKVSGLYHITDHLGIRSTYATGFHAPTPGQQHFSGLTTELSPDGVLIDTGLVPASSAVAQAVGAKDLEPEKSRSLSAGLVFDSSFMNLTVDYFRIKMRNRLTQSQSYTLTDAQREALAAEGFGGALGIGAFRFFTNDFSSTTQGVDVVASFPLHIVSTGKTALNIAANYTKTKVTSFDPTDPTEQLSTARVIQLEKMNPRYRANATLTHGTERWNASVRVNYYGKYTELHVNAEDLPIYGKPRATVDLYADYKLTDFLTLAVGADNALDTRPTKNPWADILGSKYPTTAPSGLNGGFYYAQLRFNF